MIPIAKPLIGDDEKKAVLEVLSSGMLAQGEKVREFEQKFAKYIGTKYAVATSNGTTAIHLTLLALGTKKGDEVITTPFTFISTATPILFCGAKPVFADIDRRTFNIDPEEIESSIKKSTKLILPVHLYGQPAELASIMRIAKEYDLAVVEDSCQAHGALYKNRKVGSFGDAGCFSFYPTKNMTTGEGGMVTTNNKELAERVRLLRDHGQKRRYEYLCIGYNFRLTDIAAAIGIEQLKKLDEFNAKRRENAKFLSEELSDVVEVPYTIKGVKHAFHQYTIKVKHRDRLKDKLIANGVGACIYYPKPLHYYRALRKFSNNNLKNAEKCSKEVLSLPVHPSLTTKELRTIVECVRKFV